MRENRPLTDAEFRFAELIWEYGKIGSGELVKLCAEKFGWKKSTTYTILKKSCEKGVLQNENAVVCPKISREEYEQRQGEKLIEDAFGGSLPRFLAAFMNGKRLSPAQAQELKNLIDSYREDG